jgi:hypothetical protein
MDAYEFLTQRNNGKTPEELEKDGDFPLAKWAVNLLEEYAKIKVEDATILLIEAKEALYNRDAVTCYFSGDHPCECTMCKINRFVEQQKQNEHEKDTQN